MGYKENTIPIIPERESSCETKRTSLDFMKSRGFGAFLSIWEERICESIPFSSTKRLFPLPLQESNVVLMKKTIAVEIETNAKIINGHLFFAIVTDRKGRFMMRITGDRCFNAHKLIAIQRKPSIH